MITSQKNSLKKNEVDHLFELRLKSYVDSEGLLTTNLKLQGVFVLLSLLLVLKNSRSGPLPESESDDVKIPIGGQSVPSRWLHLILPLIFMYLWLQFGFLLNELINIRMGAWSIIHSAEHKEYISGAAAEQMRLLFRDSGMIDLWFNVFRAKHYDTSNPAYTSAAAGPVLLIGVYAVLVGVMHGCTFGVLCNSWARFVKGVAGRIWHIAFAAILMVVFLGGHWVFYFNGRNPNWGQSWVLWFAFISCAIISWVWKWVPQQAPPDTATDVLRKLRELLRDKPE